MKSNSYRSTLKDVDSDDDDDDDDEPIPKKFQTSTMAEAVQRKVQTTTMFLLLFSTFLNFNAHSAFCLQYRRKICSTFSLRCLQKTISY